MLVIYVAVLFLAGLSHAIDETSAPTIPTSDKPFGAYYCQARCLASCLETFLAPSLQECEKFCPPFQDSMPCPPDNSQCWLTCGVPVLANDPPAPDSPVLTPVILGNDQEQDPFVVEMTWNEVANASLYIVEFFPHNRAPKPGESNFFQVMTTSLTYKAHKEDECVEYSGRVIAVNSYGISTPTYAFIGAPIPTIGSTDHFGLRTMQRDPWSAGMVTVTIDYSFPLGWPVDDMDIDSIRVSASDCKGSLGDRSFGAVANQQDALNPSYDAIIGKSPTTAIQLSFFDDIIKSDCMIQMKIAALVTRCNTSISFEDNIAAAPGISFRINCATVEGACETSNDTEPIGPPAFAPIPIPTSIAIDPEVVVPPINTPGQMPTGIEKPDEGNVTEPSDDPEMPTPPPLPIFVIGESNQDPSAPVPPISGGRVSIIEISPNGTGPQTMEIIPQAILPALCELEMVQAEPSLSQMASSLIDLKVTWLERQPLPAPPPPSYFVIRYGPIIRKLVDDNRELSEIIPGYETIVRTGQAMSEMPMLPDPVRELNLSAIQRGSLLKIQICAIIDPSSEALIEWNTVPDHRIDLAALEPFLDLEDSGPMSPPSPDMTPVERPIESTVNLSPVSPVDPPPPVIPSEVDDSVDIPLLINVNVDPKPTQTTYWMSVMACMLLIVTTLMLIFVFLRRMCITHRRVYKVKDEKPIVVVATQPHKPIINETIKVPLP